MKKRFALELLAIVLLTAIFALFEKVYFDGNRFFDDEMFLDYALRHVSPTTTAPNNQGSNAAKAGKDH
jgi:hypothetical protein